MFVPHMIASASRVERFNAAHRLHNPNWSDEKNIQLYHCIDIHFNRNDSPVAGNQVHYNGKN